MARVDAFLAYAERHRATDLHLRPDSAPVMRRAGDLVPLPHRPLSAREVRQLTDETLGECDRATLAAGGETVAIHVAGANRYRVSAIADSGDTTVVFRALPASDALECPTALDACVHGRAGLIWIGGPTGSGRTTIAGAALRAAVSRTGRRLIAISAVSELVPDSQSGLVAHRAVRPIREATAWARAIRHARLEGADVIAVDDPVGTEALCAVVGAAASTIVIATFRGNDPERSLRAAATRLDAASRRQLAGVLQLICGRSRRWTSVDDTTSSIAVHAPEPRLLRALAGLPALTETRSVAP